ncbi:hypothetical protein C0J52_08880 [Blattella germanica]|nr:hypothetical protein C0J52_08880 [Blattella germanica]
MAEIMELMNMTMKLNFSEICRLCMIKSSELLPLYLQNDDLPDRVMAVLPAIKLCAGDGLPTQVCFHCVQQVSTCYSFKLQCETADTTLRQLRDFHQETTDVKEESDTEITTENNSVEYETIGLQDDVKKDSLCTVELHIDVDKEIKPDDKSSCAQQDINNKPTKSSVKAKLKMMKIGTKEKKFTCTECGKRYVDRKQLKRHRLLHSGAKPYTCEICGKNFQLKYTLKTHYKIHQRGKPFSCEKCNESFELSAQLKKHMKTHLELKESDIKKFVCDVCVLIALKKSKQNLYVFSLPTKYVRCLFFNTTCYGLLDFSGRSICRNEGIYF